VNGPALVGLHHVKVPVLDLDLSLAWYQRVLGARHLSELDHVNSDGLRYAVILELPDTGITLELWLAPLAAQATEGYDPISFAVDNEGAVHQWANYLDEHCVEHSPVFTSLAGPLLVFRSPDGLYLRLLARPADGIGSMTPHRDAGEPQGPWLVPPIMAYDNGS
jgi:catechol 2,3-dioxygenase-like lactoylglutathione lyase family enzyme